MNNLFISEEKCNLIDRSFQYSKMNPSEANVFSSGISGCLPSKKRKDVSYSRLNQTEDDSVEFSNVHFQKDRTSLCSKVCFSLLALILLFATVATAVFMMNLRNFTVEVQLERGNVRVYSFDQELTAITGNEITARNMSIVVSMHLINKTESHCWFGIVLSFPEDAAKTSLDSKDHVFLTYVRSAELGSIEDNLQNHFKVFGSRETSQELSFYVHNILHQLLPTIKVKLYEYVLSKVSSSSRRTVVEKHGFLPGRVRVKQTMITKRDMVTVTAQAGSDDFESFSNPEKRKTTEKASWKPTYDETTVVNKETGMVKRNDMSLSCNLPIGGDFTPESKSSRHGLAVRFRSVVKLLDTPHSKVKTWKNALQKAKKDINYPLNLPNAKRSSLMYFAPRKHKSKGRPAEEVKELIKLGKNSAGRSTKLPSMIKIVRQSIPKSVNAQESEANGNDDDDYTNFYNEGSDNANVNDNEDENDNDDDNNGQYWPQPDYAPFGIGYEVKRRRSVEKKRQKTVSKSQMQKRTPKLDVIWDELVSSAPKPLREAPRIIQTTVFGLDFRAEIDYQVESNDGDDDDNANDEEDDVVDWSITTSYRITFGQYRVTPFTRVHTLKKLRNRLPLRGQRKISRSTINAGDFVICVPLFYIQRLCAALRLTFDLTVTDSLPRLSLSYPVEMTVRIGQTVTTNATVSGHASTWFHESGFFTEGTIAMATLPVRLSFKEDTTPEWCIKGNLEQRMVRINTVPLSSWNCLLDSTKLSNTCKGLPATNASLPTFDLQYSSAEGTMFDNWHYPISCVHRKDFSSYR